MTTPIRLSTEDVNDGEDDDPDSIDEMPVERKNFQTAGVLGSHGAIERKDQREREHDEADQDVRGMQADQ